MAKYKNEKVLKRIGERIQRKRIEQGLEIEDIVEMTGFSSNTIRQMEAGSETSLSYFVEVCLALGKHPMEILDFNLVIEPRHRLPATRKEKSRLTNRILAYIQNDFFAHERSASEVVNELKEDYGIKTTTSAVSVIMNRMVKNDKLVSSKKKAKNFYKKPK